MDRIHKNSNQTLYQLQENFVRVETLIESFMRMTQSRFG